MPSLHQRHRQPEIMDQPGLAPERHRLALAGLARINFFSRSAGILWPALLALSRELSPRPLRLLDVATGGGDVPVRLAKRARRRGLEWQVTGWDVSAQAVTFARDRAQKAGVDVTFAVRDALAGPPVSGFDAVMCSLFLHHLDEDQAVALLRLLAGLEGGQLLPDGPRLMLVNDLERSLLGYVLAYVGTRLLSTSGVVHTDGPLSVEGAFTPPEALGLAQKAGLHGARVDRRWPCRWLLTWRRP